MMSPGFAGSKRSPHIININIQYPERNREFDVVHFQNFEHNNYIRAGFHIRRSIAFQDRHLWTAKLFTGDPAIQDRSILIKGPSRDFWLTKPDLYHRNGTCKSTKYAHMASSVAIVGDVERQFTYWLLVFPEPIVLDSGIFSGDPFEVERGVVGMQTREENIDFRGVVVFWRVSEKYGGCRLRHEKQDSISDIFN
jgi:hypothetical protein